ncbi:CO(2)-response secreted protease-like isoform X1 [Syzygium oleosum]|uniref:CO(2)-response secreted protease-like isoform X1 n=2 Tax=Syzygium oleosum TaxID=219896 RepID=UPI0011D1E408|nr:CO(2)-response secreted protease-like isoform X1 [Syzygium oleosum]
MKGAFAIFLFFLSSFISILGGTKVAQAKDNGVYIVYMGAAASTNESLRYEHTQLLSSLKRKGMTLVHSYSHSFSGFAARLSEEEVRSIAQKPGVISVFKDPLLQLHTTRSWDFLKYQIDLEIDSSPSSDSDLSTQEYDTIIGIMDTGIWPESKSFDDKDLGPIPPRWKGKCMEGDDFRQSNCNRKLIGARFYVDPDEATADRTPRDMFGHGTHVASTAGGSAVLGASFYGLAAGTAKGGSPRSRIAIYRVCLLEGCRGSAIMAAFDDAISDGVDVVSLSLGASAMTIPDVTSDPIAIGAFHAAENGIIVVCSAGNDGPNSGTVVNASPWILTVSASTIDRNFESDVVLGGNKVIKGEGINFSSLDTSPVYPLIYAKFAQDSEALESEARNCNPSSMDAAKIEGKIVVCDNDDNEYSEKSKLEEVKDLGGVGLILVDDEQRSVASIYGAFPMTVVSSEDASEILSYMNSTSNPVATVLATVAVANYKPAPSMAYFSSRGPSSITKNILKPDVTAPGVAILAAWIGNDTAGTPGKAAPSFNVLSGTSMACPHVSGLAATIKSRNPTWGPSAIRSAIMTTAIQTNNLRGPITTYTGTAATPYDYGAGEVSTTRPLQPGLVYETDTRDYLNFLCYYGYNIAQIRHIARNVSDGFSCPQGSSSDLISNINYPSIAISGLDGNQSKTVVRTLTNVAGDDATIYMASIDAPEELNVKVVPSELEFETTGQKQSYQVVLSLKSLVKEHLFGSITWTNGQYKVRSPIVVSSKK